MDMKMFCRHAAPVAMLLLLLFAGAAQGAPVVSATDSDTLQTDLNGDGKVNRGDTVRHTITITNTGIDDATGTAFTETIDTGTTMVPGSLKSTPVAIDDSYTTVGNVRIQVPAAEGVLKNDFGIPPPTAIVVAAGTSDHGGNVTVDADGGFTYDPPAGFTGTDTFTYTVENEQGSDTGTVTVTVSGTIWFVNAAVGAGDGRLTSPFNCLVGPGCFNDLPKKAGDNIFLYSGDYTGGLTLMESQKLIGQGATASLASITGLTPGNYSDPLPTFNGNRPTITTSGVTLGSNNTLRGFNINAAISSGTNFGTLTALEIAVNSPVSALSLTNGTANAAFTWISSGGGTSNVSLTNVNGAITITGGNWSGASGPAFLVSGGNVSLTYGGNISQTTASQPLLSVSGGHSGTLAFTAGTLSATNGTGLQFDNADGNYNFNGTITLSGGDAGIDIVNGSNGNFTFASSSSITNPIGAAFLVTGGNGTIAFNGTISKTNSGRLVDIQSRSGGSVAFSGGLTCSHPCTGIYVRNPTLVGTLSITGSNNTLSTANATALHVENTAIAAAGLAFKSISTSGGDYGIYLNNTGIAGGLTVTGDGGVTADGSGGTIRNIAMRGASFTNAAKISLSRMNFTDVGTQSSGSNCGDLGSGSTTGCNAGIHLQNITDATLNYLTMNRGSQQGINGSSVTNFHLSNSTVQNFGDGAWEDGVRVQNLLGTSDITNCTISNNRSRQVNIKNSLSSVLNFTMNGCTLTAAGLTSPAWINGEYLMQFSGQSAANMTASIQASNFQNNNALAGGFQSNSVGTTAMNITINNSTFTSLNAASIDIIQGGSANVFFNVTNNTLTGNTQGNLINIFRAGSSSSTSTLKGKILSNTLGNPGNSSVVGSAAGSGIAVSSLGSGTTTVQVDNNSVSHVTQHGIYVSLQENNGVTNSVNATLTNNRISNYNFATVGFHGIMVQSGTTGADTGTLCASITGNTSVNGPNFGLGYPEEDSNHAMRVRQRYLTTFRMPGYPGANNDNAAAVSFIRGNNTATTDWVSATNNVAGGGGGFLYTSSCPLP
jgi:uncharacterized repeat protein (TIGR01451 family)